MPTPQEIDTARAQGFYPIKTAWIADHLMPDATFRNALLNVLSEPRDSRNAAVLTLGQDDICETNTIGYIVEVGDSCDRNEWEEIVAEVRAECPAAADLLVRIDAAGFEYVRIGD